VLLELNELLAIWNAAVDPSGELVALQEELRRVNWELWQVEDRLRAFESRSDFGPEFVADARSVYKLNDQRFQLKRRVDALLGSALSETKVYVSDKQ